MIKKATFPSFGALLLTIGTRAAKKIHNPIFNFIQSGQGSLCLIPKLASKPIPVTKIKSVAIPEMILKDFMRPPYQSKTDDKQRNRTTKKR